MALKPGLKIGITLLICAGIGVGIYFLTTHYLAQPRKGPGKKITRKTLQRKLAYSSDPSRLLEKAREAEARYDYKTALEWYNILLKNLREDDLRRGTVYYRRAFCYYQLEDYVRAKNTMEYGLNHYPDMLELDDALFLMAKIYTRLGDFEPADKTYNTIIRLFPQRADEARQAQSQLPQNLRPNP